jgi:rhodanese-related sulfurtransferase
MILSNLKFLLLACLIVTFTASFAGGADGFSLISKDQLKQDLTKPDVIVIDVRIPQEWDSTQWKIQGARRESPAEVNEWMSKYSKDKTIVLYCA